MKPIDIIPLIDLTSLNADDNEASIIALCEKATTPFGPVAAVCVYPKFVKLVSNKLNNKAISIATVVNFPSGDSPLAVMLNEIDIALSDGANEIDMVFPYRTYIHGEKKEALGFIVKARELCKNTVRLKVIIETGELGSIDLIKKIVTDIIPVRAHFIKTSTGKTKQGATIEAAKAILTIIKNQTPIKGYSVGIKVSGGVRTIVEAASYMELANEIMGNHWVNPNVFRIGASRLLDEILSVALNKDNNEI